MADDAAHRRWWQTFEVVFGIPFLVAIALQFTVPLSFPRGLFTPLLISGGAILMIAGVAIVVLARRAFARHNQPTDPGQPTKELVITGVFSVSRNPLYLGGLCILVGIALAFNLPWVLVLLLPALVACHYLLIAPEERYLAAKFGERYQRYTASVGRWLGRTEH
ncbi:MAG: isoprenylcysteine carboxylmethyltransferase family protein [Caldilineaceae bacterium]|nr:isoprenylcysteine carboxylmethyltransferase family protein [Caldilineaceae bacterium]